SERSDGQSFPTVYATRELGLLVRQRIRKQALGLRFGYGGHRFEFESSGPSRPDVSVTPDVPSVDYRFLRIGVESQLLVWMARRFLPSSTCMPVFEAGKLESSLRSQQIRLGALSQRMDIAYRCMRTFEMYVP